MKRKSDIVRIFFDFLVILFLFANCSKKEILQKQVSESKSQEQKVVTENSANTDIVLANYTYSNSNEKSSAFRTKAHAKYLEDPMEFKPIPNQSVKNSKTLVVASDFAVFYSKDNFSFDSELSARIKDPQNMSGIPVPYATLLNYTGYHLYNSDPDLNSYCSGMFNFQDNWNWFYEVEYNGQIGYVFGSDLFGFNNSYGENCIAAELYRTNGKFQEFYPISGYTFLSEKVIAQLEKNRLAIQYAGPLTNFYTDDMIHEYNKIIYGKGTIQPVFITTDFAAHCQHVTFDRMLQYTEEKFFLSRLQELTQNFIEIIKDDSDVSDEIKKIALSYFQIPQALLRFADIGMSENDDLMEKSSMDSEKYSEKINSVINEYPEEIKSVLLKIVEGSSVDKISWLGDETYEDFSQYKPRGHYTKNLALQSYFRAEMWYGRIHFLIANTGNFNESDSDLNNRILERTAFYLINLVHKNDFLYRKWQELYEPITELIGYSDDLGFEEVLPLWKELDISNFKKWSSDDKGVLSLMKVCNERLRPPAISGISFAMKKKSGSQDKESPVMGFRFLGQRFTWDSYVHQQVSDPRLKGRKMVSGLDIMKAFGSRTADWLLQQSEYPMYDELESKLNKINADFEMQPSSFWSKTYYNYVLAQIKALASFEQGAGFYWSESPLWNVKAMLSAHGTWAELKHDSILYAKQTYAEMGGGGDFEPTFRTKPLPLPVNYIEPNVPFWQISLDSIKKLKSVYKKYNLLDDDTEDILNLFLEIYKKCLDIAEKEAADLPVTNEQNMWIRTLPNRFNTAIMIHNIDNSAVDNEQNKMACIADVFTNGETGACLEVGVGRPHIIYVPLNDAQGGKRIALGVIFSYYEFTQPQSSRLNDEEWKDFVYKSADKIEDKMPLWEQKIIIPYEKF